MKFSRRTRLSTLGAVAVFSLWGSVGHSRSDREVRLRDDCDPVTFNEVLGPGGCIGDGHTTFTAFIDELTEDQSVGSWKYNPDDFHIDRDEHLVLVNRGGETHTFTRVARFGGGFVANLNALSGNDTPAPECAEVQADGTLRPRPPGPNNLFVPARSSQAGPAVAPGGVIRFQCCIHPWMRTQLRVR